MNINNRLVFIGDYYVNFIVETHGRESKFVIRLFGNNTEDSVSNW